MGCLLLVTGYVSEFYPSFNFQTGYDQHGLLK